MKKIKIAVLFFLGIFNCTGIYAYEKCEQIVKIKYLPYHGVKVYNVTSGDKDRRGVIDLGHFSGMDINTKINIGTVEVSIEMKETNSKNVAEKDDIEFVNISKLNRFIWNYNYVLTTFVGEVGETEATISIDNFEIKSSTDIPGNGTISFVCDGEHDIHAKRLEYKFDLILELTSVDFWSMYAISPRKNSGTGAFINIKDIVLDQLQGSNTVNK